VHVERVHVEGCVLLARSRTHVHAHDMDMDMDMDMDTCPWTCTFTCACACTCVVVFLRVFPVCWRAGMGSEALGWTDVRTHLALPIVAAP